MKGVVFVMSALVVAAAGWGLRAALQEPLRVESTLPERTSPQRTRVKLTREHCPPGLEGFQAELAQVRAETRRVQAETDALQDRAMRLGEPFDAEALDAVNPAVVGPRLEALLPENATATWSCDEVPCTTMVVLDDAAAAEALREQVEAAYPGATFAPVPVDEEGYHAQEDAVGHALFVQVMPEVASETQKDRAYYLGRHPRNRVRELMRAELTEAR